MRQARAAMRSGAAMSRAAASDEIRGASAKWQPGLSPLEEEEKLKVIVPTNAQQLRQINTMIDTLMQDGNLDPDVRRALAMWKVNYQMESVPDQVRRAFLEGFWCWLLGRGTDDDTKRTLWGRANVAAHNPEVAAYLETFARKRTEYAARLVLMAEHVPDTLVGFYLYFKYIVKGALKKVQDGADSSKWFWSLSDEQFLEDWDLFEQEAGNYAHMIAPAANRPPGSLPFGGSEINTVPTDPYPAQPSDRKLEACMDNLAQQILNLNQSLSISHVDRSALMSLSRRRTQSTEAGTLAGAGNDMSQVVDEQQEFDPDGDDGRDDEAQPAAELSEKLNETNASLSKLDESIRELLAHEQRRLQDKEERRAAELAKAATVAIPDTPDLQLGSAQKAFERLQSEEFREELAEAVDTPESIAKGVVESPPVGETPRPEGLETPSPRAVYDAIREKYAQDLKVLQAKYEDELAASKDVPVRENELLVARIAYDNTVDMRFHTELSDLLRRRAQDLAAAKATLEGAPQPTPLMDAQAVAPPLIQNAIIRNEMEQRISNAISDMSSAEKAELSVVVDQLSSDLADAEPPKAAKKLNFDEKDKEDA